MSQKFDTSQSQGLQGRICPELSTGLRSTGLAHKRFTLETPVKEVKDGSPPRWGDEVTSAGCSTAAELYSEERLHDLGGLPSFLDEGDDGGSGSRASDEGQDPNEVEEVQAFGEHCSHGRFLEARAELDRLRSAGLDPNMVLSGVEVERTLRITKMYEQSLELLQAPIQEMANSEINDKLGLHWGFEFRDGMLKMMTSCHLPDLDVVRCFAAAQERDLQQPFSKGLEKAEVLHEQNAFDNFWRSWTFSKTTNTKNDNVTLISGMDCLDAPGNGSSLWSAMYTPSEEASESVHVAIPPVEEGRVRAEYSFMAFYIVPLVRSGAGDRSHGLVLKILVETKLPSAVTAVLSVMPSFMLKKLMRNKVEAMPKQFREFVKTSKELDNRIVTGPRREFYARLRDRLATGGP